MRSPLAIAAAALLVIGLAGCASSASTAENCEVLAKPGNATKAVTVTGDFGAAPTVTFAPGLTATSTEAQAVIEGTGAVVLPGQAAKVNAQVYNAATGKLSQATPYDGQNFATLPVDVAKMGGLSKAIQCQKVGSRVVSVIGNDATLAAALGVAKEDTVVVVIDIVAAAATKADGVPQKVEDGLPQVVLGADGTPGITIPSSAAPTALKVAVLKKGAGAVVAAHATVTVQYVGVVWDKNAQPFDSSWKRGAPVDLNVDQVVPGFRDAIVGQTIGSQVLAIIPPDQGYGAAAQGSIPANSTLVFVIDILGAN